MKRSLLGGGSGVYGVGFRACGLGVKSVEAEERGLNTSHKVLLYFGFGLTRQELWGR